MKLRASAYDIRAVQEIQRHMHGFPNTANQRCAGAQMETGWRAFAATENGSAQQGARVTRELWTSMQRTEALKSTPVAAGSRPIQTKISTPEVINRKRTGNLETA